MPSSSMHVLKPHATRQQAIVNKSAEAVCRPGSTARRPIPTRELVKDEYLSATFHSFIPVKNQRKFIDYLNSLGLTSKP